MVSIHTFEMKIALRKSEQKQILKKLNVPPNKQSWTEHRYNNIGIQIILYKGKKKKFIYLKYIINPKPSKEHDFEIRYFFGSRRNGETLHSPYNES